MVKTLSQLINRLFHIAGELNDCGKRRSALLSSRSSFSSMYSNIIIYSVLLQISSGHIQSAFDFAVLFIFFSCVSS